MHPKFSSALKEIQKEITFSQIDRHLIKNMQEIALCGRKKMLLYLSEKEKWEALSDIILTLIQQIGQTDFIPDSKFPILS